MKKKGWMILLCAMLTIVLCIPTQVFAADNTGAALTENGTTIMSVNVSDSFDDEQGITYARMVCIKHNANEANNGTLIATCDQHTWVNGEQVWPIYRSTDNGATWAWITNVTDNTYGTNRKAQPMLYELPEAVGDLPAGTLLLAGNLVPDDQSSSRIVVYSSNDLGTSWELLSTVDVGGPFDYDNSATATTTTIWEPFLYMDAYGHLICAYSDERQKDKGALQALSLRYTSDGIHWSDQQNIASIKNSNDRPGMVTVTQLPNGKFMASYEVVNRPSYTQNSSVVYCKFSEDGLNWDEDDLGTLVQTADGQCLGSSPYIKWVDAGGPNGMVIIGAKWVVNSNGDIEEGGQNLFVNYNLGEGDWERYPQALTWDGEDIIYLDAFSQCLETSVDDSVLYQIANIGDPSNQRSLLQIGALPLTMDIYEAEHANLTDVQEIECYDASNLTEIGYINNSTSCVEFDNIIVPASGSYTVYVRYNNGDNAASRQSVTVNGSSNYSVTYAPTPNWHQYYWADFTCDLSAGANTISFKHDTGYAELDCIAIYHPDYDLSQSFMLKNRNSGLYAEAAYMSTVAGEKITQYEATYYPCQLWNITDSDGCLYFTNKNSSLVLDIENSSLEDGALAIQNSKTTANSQLWMLTPTDSGYFRLTNRNSGKYLEVFNNLTTNEAEIGQWGVTAYPCQEWTLVKEGMQ